MKVWIDQELCTGDGLCEEICPTLFVLCDSGFAYVKQDGKILDHPGGQEQMAEVPDELEEDVREAADECPGECIFLVA
jgi:ferredoxin